MDFGSSYGRVEVLRRHLEAKDLHERNAMLSENSYRFAILNPTDSPSARLRNVQISPENCISLDEMIEQGPDKVYEGKFLLCRSIAPSWRIQSVHLIVDDPVGEHVVTVALYNIEDHPILSNGKVPVGCIAAVMNPWLKKSVAGYTCVRCDNPKQFVVLPPDHPILNEVTWQKQLPFPSEIETESPAEKYRIQGAKHYAERRYDEAVECYSKSIELDPQNSVHLSNRAACYLALNKFALALEDADKGLKLDPDNHKLVYRKAKSLFELKKYKECAKFLKKVKHYLISGIPELGVLFKKSERFHVESVEGKYPFVKMYEEAENDPILDYAEHARFDLVQIGPGTWSQFGVVAKEDIQSGTLLFASKALAYAKNIERTTAVITLINLALEKLRSDPSLVRDFFKLRTKDPVSGEPDQVDVDSVGNIVSIRYNNELILKKDREDAAVWLYPILVNHSCVDSNCYRFGIGDFMFVRSIKMIKKGEELKACYIAAVIEVPFELRDQHWRLDSGYVCNCRLCLIESADLPEKRTKLLAIARKASNIVRQSEETPVEQRLKEFEVLFDEVCKLRQDDGVNADMLVIKRLFAMTCFENGHFARAAALFEQTAVCFEQLGLLHYALGSVEYLAKCHDARGEFAAARRWQTKHRDMAKLMLGDENMLPLYRGSMVLVGHSEPLFVQLEQRNNSA